VHATVPAKLLHARAARVPAALAETARARAAHASAARAMATRAASGKGTAARRAGGMRRGSIIPRFPRTFRDRSPTAGARRGQDRMNTLETRLRDDVKTAMKAGAKDELDVLRMLLSEGKKIVIDSGAAGDAIPDDVMLKVLRKGIKTRTESAEMFEKAGRKDLLDVERFQIGIIERYLPKTLGEADIEAVVDAVIRELGAKDRSAMGKVIKEVMARLAGQAEGQMVSRLVGARLS
jgi:uncharacterized protein YqeY